MKIRYQPSRGTPLVEIRDIKGGNPLASWSAGEERDIAPGVTVLFQEAGGELVQLDAAQALFRCGPDFVDVATGKNPLFTCKCGAPALEEHFPDFQTLTAVHLRDASGARQCMTCFLGEHPQWIVEMRARGVSRDVLDKAQAIANGARAKAVPSTPVVMPVAAPFKPAPEDAN